jgi:hypothetical protein
VLDQTILSVHGGIGPPFRSLDQLRVVKRPIIDFDENVIDCVLWSDPTNDFEFFEPSPRGVGYVFDPAAFKNFVDTNCFCFVVRGHECVSEGCSEKFDGRLLTVFSASNYCENKAAVLVVNHQGSVAVRMFLPLPLFTRTAPVKVPMIIAAPKLGTLTSA